MQIKKLICGTLLSFVLLFLCVSCGKIDIKTTKDNIFSYVNDQYDVLTEFSYKDIPNGEKAEADFIKKQLGEQTIVKEVFAYTDTVVQFYCTGSGLATGSTYVGFYFSKDDTPFAMEFDRCDLTETEPGVFDWQNEDGSHSFHTERIREQWFYFVQEYY